MTRGHAQVYPCGLASPVTRCRIFK